MQTLNFLGNGSCFNTKAGNTSAYLKLYVYPSGKVIEENSIMWYDKKDAKKALILFDCGESIFKRIMEKKLLDDIDDILIIITHLHSDHVGSLPSLIFYLHYIKNMKPKIVFGSDITPYLDICEVSRDLYDVPEKTPIQIYPYKQKHANVSNAYGYLVHITSGKTIFYSGDTTSIPDEILENFMGQIGLLSTNITEFYQDVTKYENDAHMNIHKLASVVPPDERKRITCMHFDDNETIEIAKSYGFKIAKVE